MRADTIKRLERLESSSASRPLPSKLEFMAEWNDTDDLTKALYINEIQHPYLCADDLYHSEYIKVIAGYLREMGEIPEDMPIYQTLEEDDRAINKNKGDNENGNDKKGIL